MGSILKRARKTTRNWQSLFEKNRDKLRKAATGMRRKARTKTKRIPVVVAGTTELTIMATARLTAVIIIVAVTIIMAVIRVVSVTARAGKATTTGTTGTKSGTITERMLTERITTALKTMNGTKRMIRVATRIDGVVTTAETMAVKRNETVVGMAEKSPVTATRKRQR